MSSEKTPQSETLSFGNQLKTARQHRGISDADLARKTHLGLSLIQSLEREEASVVSRVSYIRGYIRSCAKVLETDPTPILDAYEQQIGRHVVEKDRVVSLAMPLHPVEGKKKIWIAGFITVLALLLSYLYFESEAQLPISLSVLEDSNSIDEEALPLESVAVLISKDDMTTEDMLQLITVEIEVEPALPPTMVPEVSLSVPAVEPLLELSDNAVADVGSANLELIIRLRCWIEIVDAQGQILLRDVYEPLQTQTVVGVAPFDVVLGNASGIDLKVDNQDFDFARYIRRDRSAHFTIRNPDR